MKALVIYDSVFGNTEKIARSIGETLSSQADVRVIKVTDAAAQELQGLDYLFVGSPTRAFSPTPAAKEFLKSIPRHALEGAKVAAFDTRADLQEVNSRFLNIMVKFFGYAADPISKRLAQKGGRVIQPPEGFFVKGTEGPLADGELERAAAWAQQVVQS